MSRGLNKVMLIGNLGRDPEMRYTPSGRPVTAFSVAVNRAWQAADGERHDETDWFNVVAWGDLAETCNRYLHKGDRVYVEGRLKTRIWEGNDGQKHERAEVIASELVMLGGPGRESAAGDDLPGDEIPF
ncbi:MAG: single-stranded DNA-binding protein [Chloroflexi bacterium]|nr:single-stranded DNA-binding protein [Chloroflexota bacterium]